MTSSMADAFAKAIRLKETAPPTEKKARRPTAEIVQIAPFLKAATTSNSAEESTPAPASTKLLGRKTLWSCRELVSITVPMDADVSESGTAFIREAEGLRIEFFVRGKPETILGKTLVARVAIVQEEISERYHHSVVFFHPVKDDKKATHYFLVKGKSVENAEGICSAPLPMILGDLTLVVLPLEMNLSTEGRVIVPKKGKKPGRDWKNKNFGGPKKDY